jgi:hypothetical protein
MITRKKITWILVLATAVVLLALLGLERASFRKYQRSQDAIFILTHGTVVHLHLYLSITSLENQDYHLIASMCSSLNLAVTELDQAHPGWHDLFNLIEMHPKLKKVEYLEPFILYLDQNQERLSKMSSRTFWTVD